MKHWKETLPARTVVTKDKWGRSTEVHFPQTITTVAPTLAKVHSLLWSDYGPLVISWRHGWLCPFHPDVSYKNITCSDGLRGTSFCNGILIRQHHIEHLPPSQRQTLLGSVICYNWCRLLAESYWAIPTDELLQLSDSVRMVESEILEHIYKDTGRTNWSIEIEERQHKRRPSWLKAIPINNSIT